MSVFQRLALSKKILIGIVPLFLLFLTVSVAVHNHFQEKEMMAQAQEAAHTYADIIREALVSMMINNYEVDESFLNRINRIEQFDTLQILVNDLRLQKSLMTEKRIERLETKYKNLRPQDDVERQALLTGKTTFLLSGDRFRAVVPFNATAICQKCHDVPLGYTLGATDMHISLERISRAAAESWTRSGLVFVAFTIVAFAVGTLMFRQFVSRPVMALVDATRAISEGNLESPPHPAKRVTSRSDDELGFLAKKFDDMRGSLKGKIEELDQVNRSLSERNRDIEEALRRLAEAQEELVRNERLAVTGKMTAQLSHEINNPIHNIQSLLESSLRKINGNRQARELIGVALEEVVRMAKLTRQMLDLHRTSVVEIEKEPVDLREVLTESVRANEEAMLQNGIHMALVVPESLPAILGSRDKLKQVFLNLFANARDAMPDGGTIAVRARAAQEVVRIEVSDTGVGIPPEHLGRIFEPFFTTKKEVSGVGLGLTVTYGIIQQHGGTIRAESNVGQGTTFTIEVPVAH